jgi:large subunit ribosomal protein L18e
MISKTQISVRTKRKTNPELVETINLCKKNNLLDLAKKLSSPTRQQKRVNLNELDNIKENKIIVVGKVLGSGEINRKISVSALSFSEQAKEKLKKALCEIKKIKQEIENNPKLDGVKII